MTPEEELNQIKENEKKENKRQRFIEYLLLVGMLGFSLGALFGFHLGYLAGERQMFDLIMVFIGGS